MAFVMVLWSSRHLFLRFIERRNEQLPPRPCRGIYRVGRGAAGVIYDNLKSAVLERRSDAIRFHPTLLELAAHYRFQPRRGGRPRERKRPRGTGHRLFETDFLRRVRSKISMIDAQATTWCLEEADFRGCPEDRDRSVHAVFAKERPHLSVAGQPLSHRRTRGGCHCAELRTYALI